MSYPILLYNNYTTSSTLVMFQMPYRIFSTLKALSLAVPMY